MARGTVLLCTLLSAAMAAGCAASGKALIEQYQDVTPNRFEGAVAVVLETRETSTVDDKGEGMVREGLKRVKIMDRKALDCGPDAPNCRIQRYVCYNETYDKVDYIRSRTITPDGQVIEMDQSDMSDQTFTSWAIPDQDQRCWVWMQKGVTPGAIIEESFKISSNKIFVPGGFWFQDLDPILEATFKLDTPVDYSYRWKVYNTDIQPREKRAGNRLSRTWSVRDMGPIIVEEGMVAPDDVVAKLVVAAEDMSALADYKTCRSVKSWEDTATCWAEMIKERQELTEPIREVVEKINKTAKTETEKVRAVWDYMNENIRYVGLERGLAGLIPLSAHVVCTKKYGDCKAVAGLISVLCRELGLRADPILIGTRNALGQVDLDMPGMFYFNHSIARVEADGKTYFLDATNRIMDYTTTPHVDQGVHVIVARPGAPFVDFVPVQPAEQNLGTSKIVFTPQTDGSVEMEYVGTFTGNSAGELRGIAHAYTDSKWSAYIQGKVGKAYPGAAVTEQSYTGKDDNNKPFEIRIKARIQNSLQPAGKTVMFKVKSPFSEVYKPYFHLPKRRYALDLLYLAKCKYRYEVKIPEGMTTAGLPRNVISEDDFAKMERLTQIENDRVVTEYTWEVKMLEIPVERYPEIRKRHQKLYDTGSFVLMFEPEKKEEKPLTSALGNVD